ncbi:MAG: hypothetical protein ACFFDF_11925, partial [Candidatus Odinarchaeota archaeon]
VFDGDRIVKELMNWGFGEQYKTTRKKQEKIKFNIEDPNLSLTEYRVEKINSVKIIIEDVKGMREKSEIVLAEDKYTLVDKIGDGFKDTVLLNLPEDAKLDKNSSIEISYEYWYDEKQKIKKPLLNTIRYITLVIVLGNFILSLTRFGGLLFWL